VVEVPKAPHRHSHVLIQGPVTSRHVTSRHVTSHDRAWHGTAQHAGMHVHSNYVWPTYRRLWKASSFFLISSLTGSLSLCRRTYRCVPVCHIEAP
jgi:hypothetical protein